MSRAHGPGRVAIVFFSLALAGTALAQGRAPDAGRVLEDSKTGGAPALPRPTPRLDLQEPVRPAMTAPDSFRVLVKGFRVTSTTVYTKDRLEPLLAAYVGRELNLADLEEAAAVVTRYYRDRGYFVARAYVPAQEIRDGIVEITVLEGRLGSLQIFVAPGRSVADAPLIVRQTLLARQPRGSVIGSGLDRGLLILSDTPGISARGTLSPGSVPGTSDLSVDVADTPEFTGSGDADNYGNRFTGAARLGATAYWNNVTGGGDLGTFRGQISTGSQNSRFGYQFPVGYDGLRFGLAHSLVQYRLCCEFEDLGANGTASDLTATGQYPFVRGRNLNVYGTVGFSAKKLVNRTVAGTVSDKKTQSSTQGASVDGRDGMGGGGLSAFSITFTRGDLDLSKSDSDVAIDSQTAQAAGGYSKTNYSFSRLQRLGPAGSLYVSLAWQRASKNLDSSEQLSLGGPTGVRAYPTGEAVGDEGMLAALEYRREVAENWQASAFFDRGQIRLRKSPFDPSVTNGYSLSGAGLGLTYARPGNFTVRFLWAAKIGDNPGRNAAGNDADNRASSSRAWIQAIKYL